jgi:hypothetical protein
MKQRHWYASSLFAFVGAITVFQVQWDYRKVLPVPMETGSVSSSSRNEALKKTALLGRMNAAGAEINNIATTKTSSLGPLKVPTPLFVLSLPKSGTTTTHEYFECGLGNLTQSAHHKFSLRPNGPERLIGPLFLRNVKHNLPLLSGLGNSYSVVSDYGFVNPGIKQKNANCFFPLDSLDNIARFYPNSTLVYTKRDAKTWYISAKRWGSQLWRMSNANCSQTFKDMVPSPSKDQSQGWIDFYENYTRHIQKFAAEHPSLTYVEVTLEDNATGALLEERIGIPRYCWGHANAGPPELMKS